jgi:DNA replication protein DnaC
VYEYIEQYHVPLMQKALNPVFGAGVVLRYRIMKQKPSFADVAGYLRQHSAYDPQRNPYNIHVTDAEKRLKDGLHYFLKGSEQWLPAYGQIADWLQDNKGRGLLCVGHQGLGKTLICEKILPVILGRKIKTVSASDMNTQIEDLLKERAIIIDDLGKEPAKLYGQPDTSFYKLCNAAEQRGILLIITTNLATTPVSEANRSMFPLSIQERYGNDVLSRLRATTTVVGFSGDDMRK